TRTRSDVLANTPPANAENATWSHRVKSPVSCAAGWLTIHVSSAAAATAATTSERSSHQRRGWGCGPTEPALPPKLGRRRASDQATGGGARPSQHGRARTGAKRSAA